MKKNNITLVFVAIVFSIIVGIVFIVRGEVMFKKLQKGFAEEF